MNAPQPLPWFPVPLQTLRDLRQLSNQQLGMLVRVWGAYWENASRSLPFYITPCHLTGICQCDPRTLHRNADVLRSTWEEGESGVHIPHLREYLEKKGRALRSRDSSPNERRKFHVI